MTAWEREARRQPPRTSAPRRPRSGATAAKCPSGEPHYWRLAEPDGAASLGICRRCGAERLHPNGYWRDREGGLERERRRYEK